MLRSFFRKIKNILLRDYKYSGYDLKYKFLLKEEACICVEVYNSLRDIEYLKFLLTKEKVQEVVNRKVIHFARYSIYNDSLTLYKYCLKQLPIDEFLENLDSVIYHDKHTFFKDILKSYYPQLNKEIKDKILKKVLNSGKHLFILNIFKKYRLDTTGVKKILSDTNYHIMSLSNSKYNTEELLIKKVNDLNETKKRLEYTLFLLENNKNTEYRLKNKVIFI
jgi:hypothetical protein